MKKKQFMSKLAALTMAAMMGATMLPATAIPTMAAASISSYSIDAGDAALYPTEKALTDALNKMQITSATTATQIKTFLDETINIPNLTITVTTDPTWGSASVSGRGAATTVTMPTATNTTFTLSNSNASVTTSVSPSVTLTQDVLSDTDASGIFDDYLKAYINGKTYDKGSAGQAAFTADVNAAASAFAQATGVTPTITSIKLASNEVKYKVGAGTEQTVSSVGAVIASNYTTDQVTVTRKINGSDNGAESMQTYVVGNLTAVPTGTSDADINSLKTAITGSLGNNIQNVQVIDTDHWSFEIYDTHSISGTYTVTINTGADLEDSNSALKTALDNYFATNTISKASNKTLRNIDIADKVKDDDDVKAALSGTWKITGNGDAIGEDNSGTLIITGGGVTYTYNYTADVNSLDKTTEEINREAIAAVNAKSYPDYGKGTGTGLDKDGNSVTHNATWLQKEITADLKDAGYDESSINKATWSGADVVQATKTSNGSYKVVINGKADAVNVVLYYSSDQKSSDTNKSLVKFIKKGSTAGAANVYVTEHAAGNSVSNDSSKTEVGAANVYYYGTKSALSTAIQAKSAVKAVTTADAIQVVEDKIKEQLEKDGVDANGVNVTVTAVNEYGDADNDGAADDVIAGQKDATTVSNGTVTLFVKTSIKNDFFGDQDKMRNLENKYYLQITTNPLKAKEAESISLSDKTVLLTDGYFTTSKTSGQKKGTSEFTFVKIKPVITPENANSTVTYKVVNADKEDETNTLVVGKTNSSEKVYAFGSDTAETIGANELGLKITKEGTYTITATVDDQVATMTLTVRDNFKDVPATAYYADAVKWAYGKNITAGTSDDTFGTNAPVTRAQFVTWLYKYAVSKDSSVAIADDDVESVFSDVPTTAFYAKAVQWAKENGVTAGTTPTTFSPDQAITRAQAIQMIWVAKGRPYAGEGSEYEQTLKFTDVPNNAFYRTAVRWALAKDVTAGTSATTFGPNDTCFRSQAIQFVYKMDKAAD